MTLLHEIRWLYAQTDGRQDSFGNGTTEHLSYKQRDATIEE